VRYPFHFGSLINLEDYLNIQHTAKLASANETDLDRLAAGFTLGEFGRETCHGSVM
jgi:hypothetical protein